MRFLGIGECADLASLYLRLARDRHEIRVFIGYPLCKDTLAGLIERVPNWESELDWIRAAGQDDSSYSRISGWVTGRSRTVCGAKD